MRTEAPVRRFVGVLLLLASGGACAEGGPPAPGPVPPASRAPPPPPSVEDGTIEGRLVEARTDGPVPGRAVATTADGRTWSCPSAMDGRFRMEGLPRGSWISVEGVAPGLAAREPREFEVPLVGDGQTGPLWLAPTGDLPVEVVDEAGLPVAGASVAARRPLAGNLNSGPIPLEPWPEAARAATDAAGTAVLKDLPPGSWAILASAPGFARRRLVLHHAGGTASAPRRIDLQPGFAVEGWVHLPGGDPASGAVVAALESGTRWSDSISCTATTADGAGRFRLEGLGKGRWPILVRTLPGVLEPAGWVDAPTGAPQVHRLAPRAAMHGVVSDARNRNWPVAGAMVTWVVSVGDAESDNRTARVETRTDSAGRYSMNAIPAGTLMFFEVRAAGFLPFPDSSTPRKESAMRGLVQGRTLQVDAALHRGAAVRGVVRDGSGAPVPDAWVLVRAEAENRFCPDPPLAWTDAEGRYAVPSTHPGAAVVLSRGRGLHGGNPESCSITVPPEGVLEKDLVLLPDARVRGRILLADGSPAPGFRPRVVNGQDRDRTVAEGLPSGNDGVFDLWVDRPGTGLSIVADGPDGARAVSPAIDLGAGQFLGDVEVRVPRGARLSGKVRRWDGFAPTGVALRVVPGAEGQGAEFLWAHRIRRLPTVSVEEDGSFSIDGLAPGEYSFSCTAEGCSEARGPEVRLAPGEERTGLEVVLPRGWEVDGVVESEDGKPLAGAEVFLSPLGERFQPGTLELATTTDARGEFRVAGLREGRHDLRVHLDGHPDAVRTVSAGAGALRIVLKPGFTLTGRILDAETGRPLGGIPVATGPRWRAGILLPSRRETLSAPDGTFALVGLEEGPWDLRVGRDRTFRGGTYPLKQVRGIVAGTRDLEIRLVRGRCIAGRLVDEEGRPVEGRGLEVTLENPRTGEGWSRVSRGTEADGTFAFDGLSPGRYALSIESRSFGEVRDAAWLPVRIEDVAAGQKDVVVTLRRGRPISGRMEDAPEAPPRQGYWLHVGRSGSQEDLPGNDITKVHEDGSFTTGALEEGGKYDLTVREGGALWVARGVPAGAGDAVLRREPLEGTIAGIVVDGTGMPVPEGVPVRAGTGESTLYDAETVTGPGGTFVLEGLGNLAYRVRAGGPGSRFTWSGSSPAVVPGTKGVVVRVRTGVSLRGTVRTSAGTPVARDLVLVLEGDGDSVEHRIDVAEDGTFSVEGLPPGPAVLKLDRLSLSEQGHPEIARIRVPCAPLDLRVPEEEED